MKLIFTGLALFGTIVLQAQTTSFTVYFDFNKYELNAAARARLDSFALAQKANLLPGIIDLSGHCDGVGSDPYNDLLSKRRVNTVKKYFRDLGFSESQVRNENGHGKRQPLNNNRTEEDRRLNRRVEILYSQVSAGTTKGGTLKEQIADTATITGTNIVLRNINFIGGLSHFLPESLDMLDELLEAMKAYPNLVIRIEGHICCQQGDVDGTDLETGLRNLSSSRANTVMGYLLSNGISMERVSAIGYGHRYPIHPYPESTEQERIENRRVEIKIIKK